MTHSILIAAAAVAVFSAGAADAKTMHRSTHAMHHMTKLATPAEREATRKLNEQQLAAANGGAAMAPAAKPMQGDSMPAATPTPPTEPAAPTPPAEATPPAEPMAPPK